MNDIQKAGLSANQHIISHTYEYVVFFKYEKNNNKKMFSNFWNQHCKKILLELNPKCHGQCFVFSKELHYGVSNFICVPNSNQNTCH